MAEVLAVAAVEVLAVSMPEFWSLVSATQVLELVVAPSLVSELPSPLAAVEVRLASVLQAAACSPKQMTMLGQALEVAALD